ncbi:MAG: cytochrome c biogenesis protein CcdA [Rhodothermales bacterium]
MSLFRTLLVLATLCLVAVGVTSTARAQNFGPATDYVTWTTTADPAAVARGQTTRVVFAVTIDDGWKMYALGSPKPSRAVSVTFDELPTGLALQGEMQQNGEKQGYDPNFKKDVIYFEKEGVLWADVAVAADAEAGARAVSGTIHFMICNDRLCLPPTNVPFETTLEVGAASSGDTEDTALRDGGVAAPPVVPPSAPPLFVTDSLSGLVLAQVPVRQEATDEASEEATITAATDFDTARSGGLWGFLLLAMGAGLAALLTPCVFPMIPLTVSYFTKHSDDRRKALRMAVVYGGAIIITFTGLGVLMAVLVGAAGAQSFAANPWVNLFIGVVFVVFALSLLGLFELRLPSGLLNFFNRKSDEKQGYLGVLFMGFTLTLVSFSCTAPFVGGLLAATTMGSWSYPVLGMVVFSATFSLPFMFFALFPQALSSLPKSGSWMNVVKVVLGFIELAAALKFLSNADLVWGWELISRTLAIALVVVIFFLTGLYLLGKLRLKHEPAVEQIGVGRLLASIAFFGLAIYLIPGLLGAPLNKLDAYLPPRQANDVSMLATIQSMVGGNAHLDEAWITDDIETAFAQAEAESKPVMIDFTGYTCTNCREMEANVFTRPEVAERFERNFVLLRLYTDGIERGQEFQRFQIKLTGTVALPTYAIVSPFEQKKPIVRISGVVAAQTFASFLDQGTASFLEQSLAARD